MHPGGFLGYRSRVTREAYSHEVSSAGFWPGNETFPLAAFYSYAYPEPAGFQSRPLPAGARYDATLREFVVPYDTVRGSIDPEGLLLDFLSTTYAAAADAGNWDRATLECALGSPAQVRRLWSGLDGQALSAPQATSKSFPSREACARPLRLRWVRESPSALGRSGLVFLPQKQVHRGHHEQCECSTDSDAGEDAPDPCCTDPPRPLRWRLGAARRRTPWRR